MKLTTEDQKALQGAMNVLMEILQQAPPEVPDRVEVWPENDDEHLRGEVWKSSRGYIISYRDDKWHWWNSRDRTWHLEATPGLWTPLNRIADPSQPRRFDSLADIPEDVDRVAGKYLGYPCELARSPLSGTGWMMRVDHPYVRQQWVEYMDLGEDDLTDIEEVIDHD